MTSEWIELTAYNPKDPKETAPVRLRATAIVGFQPNNDPERPGTCIILGHNGCDVVETVDQVRQLLGITG